MIPDEVSCHRQRLCGQSRVAGERLSSQLHGVAPLSDDEDIREHFGPEVKMVHLSEEDDVRGHLVPDGEVMVLGLSKLWRT